MHLQNDAFRENKDRLNKLYGLDVLVLKAPEAIRTLYNSRPLPQSGTKAFDTMQQHLKVEPFQYFLRGYKPDFWFTDIRQSDNPQRAKIDIFSTYMQSLIKVSPFAHTAINKYELYEKNSNFTDICKPTKYLECGLHNH